jgi:hypothetical protein
MPAKARELRSAAPSASPAPGGSRSSRSRSSKTVDSDSTDEVSVAAEAETEDDEVEEEATGENEAAVEEGNESAEAATGGKLSMMERMEKMKELRSRMVSHGPPLLMSHHAVPAYLCCVSTCRPIKHLAITIPRWELTCRINPLPRTEKTLSQTTRNPK